MRRLTLDALHRPHPESERFEPDFPVSIKCADCGRIGYGPRKHMKDAIDEHRKVCPSRVTHDDAQPFLSRIFYPVT